MSSAHRREQVQQPLAHHEPERSADRNESCVACRDPSGRTVPAGRRSSLRVTAGRNEEHVSAIYSEGGRPVLMLDGVSCPPKADGVASRPSRARAARNRRRAISRKSMPTIALLHVALSDRTCSTTAGAFSPGWWSDASPRAWLPSWRRARQSSQSV
jgi:hypothetical protein